ncbi:MAG TPA: hypothetical protein VGC87_13810 [Pyrinomonadaceae bacterium]|jgi:hypothetical protein
MLTTGWSVLRYFVWGLAALHLIMAVSIWGVTLRTLGPSSLRYCPRVLRLSFRASPIREVLSVILLPIVAILLLRTQGIGDQFFAALPLNALLLVGLLYFTLLLVPPTVLVFSSSTDEQLRWALSLKKFAGGRRVISLLDTGYMKVKPNAGDVLATVSRRSISLADVLRTSDADDWQSGVKELIEMSPIVVVDTRVCTQAVLFEASTMLTPEHAYKAIFVSDEDGACPVLERLLDEGGVAPSCPVSVVTENELGEVLRSLVTSGNTLPKPGRFARTPSRIGERPGLRRAPERQATRDSTTAPPRSSHAAALPAPEPRKTLSSPLTAFWRLLAKWSVVQVLLLVAWGLWIMWTQPQLIPTRFAVFVLWSVLACLCGSCALYFYLARSLKTVCVEGDSLFVSENSKECEIHLSQVSRVTGPDLTGLRRITIHLHRPSACGEKIVFAGKFLSAGTIARDLRRRLYAYAEEKGRAKASRG